MVKWWIRINLVWFAALLWCHTFVSFFIFGGTGTPNATITGRCVCANMNHWLNYVQIEKEIKRKIWSGKSLSPCHRRRVYHAFVQMCIACISQFRYTRKHYSTLVLNMRVSYIYSLIKLYKHNGFLLYINFGAIESEIEQCRLMRMKETKSIEIMAKMYEEEASNEKKNVNTSKWIEIIWWCWCWCRKKMKVLATVIEPDGSNLFSFFLTVELCT